MKIAATECALAAIAAALAGPDAPLTEAERALVGRAPPPSSDLLQQLRNAIAAGDDPLGSTFCRLRPSKIRRKYGAVYTPRPIIDAMIKWAVKQGSPARIIDPGAGSGRFLLAAAKTFPDAQLVAVEIDPLAALMLRANASVMGMNDRLTLYLEDYRKIHLQEIRGLTLFIGNPPYVRHHYICQNWKDWLSDAAAAYGLAASKLSGLHIHFFLRTYQLARPGDYGTFITSAEWLDVNYGEVLRNLLTDGLGGISLHIIAPEVMPFSDAATTGAITCFRIGRRRKGIYIRSIDTITQLNNLRGGKLVSWSRLDKIRRWSTFLRTAARTKSGYIELGELCRVHRGQVTGCNSVWIAGNYSGPLPQSVLVPTVTKARELFDAGSHLVTADKLRCVIDLPVDLDELDEVARIQVDRFLRWAAERNADKCYIARNRRPWWAVKLPKPAPILCTYMARRPPAFVRNLCGARHLNIAHGIYPRQRLPDSVLDGLAAWLRTNVRMSAGRTYAGGLTKFEPKELERILVPPLEELHA